MQRLKHKISYYIQTQYKQLLNTMFRKLLSEGSHFIIKRSNSSLKWTDEVQLRTNKVGVEHKKCINLLKMCIITMLL